MMRVKNLLIMFLFIAVLVSCQTESTKLEYAVNKSIITYSADETNETEPEISKFEDLDIQDGIDFLSETRNLNNLIDVKVYWNENDLNVNYYFTEEASKSDVQKALDFYSTTILTQDGRTYYDFHYEMVSLVVTNRVDDRILRIFIDDNLIIKTIHRFDENYVLKTKKYFENNIMDLSLRNEMFLPGTETQDLFSETLVKGCKVNKAIKPFTAFVHVDINKDKDETIDSYVDNFQKEFESNYIENYYDDFNKTELNTIIFTFFDNKKILSEQKLIIENEMKYMWTEDIWN